MGGRATTTVRFLGSRVSSELELTEWDPPRSFRYTMVHEGRPTSDHRRTFDADGSGTVLVGTTEAEPRPGFAGVFDRFQIYMLKRLMDATMLELESVIAEESTARAAPRT